MPSIAQLEQLLLAEPTDALLLYGLAQEYAKIGETAKAVAFYDKCIACDASYCYAWYHKARALQAAGMVEQARESVREGLRAARAISDRHAQNELSSLQDELT